MIVIINTGYFNLGARDRIILNKDCNEFVKAQKHAKKVHVYIQHRERDKLRGTSEKLKRREEDGGPTWHRRENLKG